MNTTNLAKKVAGYTTDNRRGNDGKIKRLVAILADEKNEVIRFKHLALAIEFSRDSAETRELHGFPDFSKMFWLPIETDIYADPASRLMTEAQAMNLEIWGDHCASANVERKICNKLISGPQMRTWSAWMDDTYYLQPDEIAGLSAAQKVWPQATRVDHWTSKAKPGEIVIGHLQVRRGDPKFPVFGLASIESTPLTCGVRKETMIRELEKLGVPVNDRGTFIHVGDGWRVIFYGTYTQISVKNMSEDSGASFKDFSKALEHMLLEFARNANYAAIVRRFNAYRLSA